MDTRTPPKPDHTPLSSIPHAPDDHAVAHRQRLAALIAQGEAEIAAGLVIDGDDLDAWLDQLDIDPNTPMPEPRPKP